jgi:hypothetical protein
MRFFEIEWVSDGGLRVISDGGADVPLTASDEGGPLLLWRPVILALTAPEFPPDQVGALVYS